MIFVALHVTNQGKLHISSNKENFENMTLSLERVTTYYLEGEQRLCNSWARYINNNNLTLKETIEYLNMEAFRISSIKNGILWLKK